MNDVLSQVEETKRRKRSYSVGQRESIGVHTRSQNGGSPAGHKMVRWIGMEEALNVI